MEIGVGIAVVLALIWFGYRTGQKDGHRTAQLEHERALHDLEGKGDARWQATLRHREHDFWPAEPAAESPFAGPVDPTTGVATLWNPSQCLLCGRGEFYRAHEVDSRFDRDTHVWTESWPPQ